MGWQEWRAERAQQGRRGAAAGDDAERTAPLGTAPPQGAGPGAGAGDRPWTLRPLERHGWKLASLLAVIAILIGGVALARSGDDGGHGHRGGHGDAPARMAGGPDGGGHRGWR